jgi:subtilisin-like proprotein convertase family protein
MAGLWETDCLTISPLANAQYPTYTTNWQYIFPHNSISDDGDVHIDMAVNSSGSGSSGNNTGASPIVCEVINATPGQLNHLNSLNADRAIFRGIFRFYTEHDSKRHFELHPVVGLDTWNGAGFVLDTDYHANVVTDSDGTTHPNSVLIAAIDGSQTMTATIQNDNAHVDFTMPSPSVNYVQYAGSVISPVTSDSTSSYFLLKPNLVPTATLKCRLVANSTAATTAGGLLTNQTVTVNALTRTDMAQVGSQIASMTAGQSRTFARPVELITLGLPTVGPTPTPTPTPTPPTTSFTNSAALPVSGNASGEGTGVPYPSLINVSNIQGIIANVTAKLNSLTHQFPADLDILLVGPGGQTVMLMSDTGGGTSISNINLTFDDSASSSLGTGRITSGTYRPTDLNPTGDQDAFPAPAPPHPYGTTMSIFDGGSPNGTWKLFVLHEFTSGSGQINNGWTVSIGTALAPPVSAVSRKVHGGAGPLDLNLPLTGTPAVECRNGGASGNFQIVITFASPVTFTSAAVSSGIGSVSSSSVNGNQVTINLAGVNNAQQIAITLSNVNDGRNSGSITIPMGVLTGDTTGDGIVNSSDLAQTKSQSGQPTTSNNFRLDVTANGTIDASDLALIKSKLGTGLANQEQYERESSKESTDND